MRVRALEWCRLRPTLRVGVHELLILAGLFSIYKAARLLARDADLVAVANAWRLLEWQQLLFLPREQTLQGCRRQDEKRGAGGFGRLWTWISSACADWPGSSRDAFRGPWKVRTDTPLLIVGNTHDPATAISGARAPHSLLPGSRLVEFKTCGHGAIGQSRCVTRRFSAYPVRQSLPDRGATCQPDRVLCPPRG